MHFLKQISQIFLDIKLFIFRIPFRQSFATSSINFILLNFPILDNYWPCLIFKNFTLRDLQKLRLQISIYFRFLNPTCDFLLISAVQNVFSLSILCFPSAKTLEEVIFYYLWITPSAPISFKCYFSLIRVPINCIYLPIYVLV